MLNDQSSACDVTSDQANDSFWPKADIKSTLRLPALAGLNPTSGVGLYSTKKGEKLTDVNFPETQAS